MTGAGIPALASDRFVQNLSKPVIPVLDGIRGLAALLVVMHHLSYGGGAVGGYAVSVFFVLSGFLITWLLIRESERAGSVSLRAFYVRRVLRLFPAYYVFWVVAIAAFYFLNGYVIWREAVATFLYAGDWYHGLQRAAGERMMVITWSLGVEEKFYLIWPCLFIAFRTRRGALIKLTIGLIVFVSLYRVFMMNAFDLPPNYLKYAFEARFDNILWGCLLALVVAAKRIPAALTSIMNRLWCALPLLLLTCASLYAEARWKGQYHYTVGMPLDAILTVSLLALLIANSESPWVSWLNRREMRFLGKISYSLYLYHLTTIQLVRAADLPRYSLFLIASIAGSIAVASLSYYLVEMPFLKLKGRFIPLKNDAQKTGDPTLATRES